MDLVACHADGALAVAAVRALPHRGARASAVAAPAAGLLAFVFGASLLLACGVTDGCLR